jgi:hypothetical protein
VPLRLIRETRFNQLIRGLAHGAGVAALVDFIAGGLAAPHTEEASS